MNRNELVYKKTNGLAPFAYAVVDKWLYFCDQIMPGLFRYHFEKEECECVVKFDRDYIKSNFYKIYTCGDELWMLPFLNEKIVCFKMSTRQMFYYDIPSQIKEKTIPFSNMFFWKEKAYITPHGNNRFLLVVNLHTHIMQEVELLQKEQEPIFFFNGAVQFQNQIYMVENSKSTIFFFDAASYVKKIIYIDGYSLDNLIPGQIEDKIYFFPVTINNESKHLLIYDIKSGCLTEDKYPIQNLRLGEVCITAVFDNKIWILANKQKKIYMVNFNHEIEAETTILNFNEDGKTQYASGVVFADCLFWNGHRGDPLIQVKDGEIRFLDVGKDKTLLEVYIKILDKQNECKKGTRDIGVGKAIYENLK